MKVLDPATLANGFDTSPRLQIARAAGRLSRSMMSLANKGLREAGYDLSLEHAIILKHLMDKDGQTHQELAEGTFKHKTSITFLIDKMVKKDLVVRQADQVDRRNKLVFLTQKGRNMVGSIFPILHDQIYRITEGVDAKDLQACIKILATLLENTQNHLNAGPGVRKSN